jgi:hypothetical protein
MKIQRLLTTPEARKLTHLRRPGSGRLWLTVFSHRTVAVCERTMLRLRTDNPDSLYRVA